MKNRFYFFLLIIPLLVSTLPICTAWAASDAYNPAQTYQGKYKANVLYLRNRNNPNWYQGLKDIYPKRLQCKDALTYFMTKGKWKGNLHADGSCGPMAEPAEWAVGNRLNFESSGAGR